MNVKMSWWVGVLAAVAAMPAMALDHKISAEFKPDSSHPHFNTFENTTPVSGYCLGNPVECKNLKMFSIQVPLRFDAVRPMQPDPNPRNNAMILVPSQWRALTVTQAATGKTETVEIRITGVGSNYGLSQSASSLTGAPSDLIGHQTLWTRSSWVYAPEPCEYSGMGYYGSHTYAFFWRTPVVGECVKWAAFPIPAFTYYYLDIAYELRTPNPLNMASGTYTGVLPYRVGPGGDFDMGDVMLPTDNLLSLNFELSVEHVLKIEIPPGGDQVELVPQGGWQAWLQHGRKPPRLFRDQTFNIHASSRFKMQLECGRVIGDTCALVNAANNHEVPLDISVSLPHGLTRPDGSAVNRQPLLLSGAGTELFQLQSYVDRKPATLHFELKQSVVAEMLDRGESTYSGTVTVIWDSEV